MASEVQSPNLVDPFQGQSILSFCPKTFAEPEIAPNDLEEAHNFMRSMALRSPLKLFEKAKTILDSTSSYLNEKFESVGGSKNAHDENVAEKREEIIRERRPDLGRKRARFSLIPSVSQPSVPLEPLMDLDQQQDPEDFFATFEKHEKARKEIQRQSGVGNLNEVNLSVNARTRRPGLSMKKVSYIHHQYPIRNENIFTDSHEIFQPVNRVTTIQVPQQDTTVPSQELRGNRVAGTLAETMNDLLQTLTVNVTKMDKGEARTLVEDRLNIKPVENISLSDFSEFRHSDFVTMDKNLPKDHNKLSGVSSSLEISSRELSIRHQRLPDSPVDLSPTPPRIPCPSTSAKPLSIDFSPPNSPIDAVVKQSDYVCMDFRKVSMDAMHLSNKPACDNGRGNSLSTDLRNTGSTSEFDAHGSSNLLNEMTLDGNAGDPSEGITVQTDEHDTKEDNVEEVHQNGIIIPKLPGHTANENLGSDSSQLDETLSMACEDGPPRGIIIPEQQNEELPSKLMNQGKGTKRARERGSLSRKSLAGAGTCWEDGKRRSRRYRSRPLEYWKGERLLYGRVHDSLPSVIGVKVITPAKNGGKPKFRLESFVSDEYKELVEYAALH